MLSFVVVVLLHVVGGIESLVMVPPLVLFNLVPVNICSSVYLTPVYVLPIRIHRDKEGSTHTGGKWQESKYLREPLQDPAPIGSCGRNSKVS